MNVRTEKLDRATVVIPEGKLDFGAAADFQKRLEEVLAEAQAAGPAAVIIDCSALDYVSSAGLRTFLLSARTAQRGGIAFALCALKPAVREVFDLSGFSRVMAVHPDRATALGQAPQPPS
jgi:anti-sigma B factor antagonist